MPWILGNVESLANSLIAGYDRFHKAQFEVILGNSNPVGVLLPLTLPASEVVIAVDEDRLYRFILSIGDIFHI